MTSPYPAREFGYGDVLAFYTGLPVGGGPAPTPIGGPGYIIEADIGGVARFGRFATISTLVAAAFALDGPKQIYVPLDAAGPCQFGPGTWDMGPDVTKFTGPMKTADVATDVQYITTVGAVRILTTAYPVFDCNWRQAGSDEAPFQYTLADDTNYFLSFLSGDYNCAGTPLIATDCGTPGGTQVITIEMRGDARFTSNTVLQFTNAGTARLVFRLFDSAILDVALVDFDGQPFEVECVSADATVLNPGVIAGMTFRGPTCSLELAAASPNNLAIVVPISGPGKATTLVDTSNGRRWVSSAFGDTWTGNTNAVTWAPSLGDGPTTFTTYDRIAAFLVGKPYWDITCQGLSGEVYPIQGLNGTGALTIFRGAAEGISGGLVAPVITFGDGVNPANDGALIGPGGVPFPTKIEFIDCEAFVDNLALAPMTVQGAGGAVLRVSGFGAISKNPGRQPFLRTTDNALAFVELYGQTRLSGGAGLLVETLDTSFVIINLFDASVQENGTLDPAGAIALIPSSPAVGFDNAAIPLLSPLTGTTLTIDDPDPNVAAVPGFRGDTLVTRDGGAAFTFWVFDATNAWVGK